MGILAIILAAAPAFGESSEITFGPSGKPTAIQMTEDRKYEIPVIVVAEGAPVLSSPKKASPVIRNAPYGSSYYLTDTQEESGRKYYLAAERSMKFVGWFREEDVLLTQQAEKESHGIFRKALIVNEWKTMTAGTNITGASALDGPGLKGTTPYKSLRELGLFKFYFVYKRSKASDGKDYFLLGLKPHIDAVSKAKDTLTGWVEADRIQQWDTRQALQFQKDTLEKRIAGLSASIKADGGGGVSIYETEDELRASLKGETKVGDEPLTAAASEDTRMKAQWSHAVQRYPLISAKANDLVPKAGQFLQVGYIGDQIFAGKVVSKDKPPGGATAAQLDEQRAKFKEVVKKMQAIDIAFVVDTTGSMQPWVEATRKAVSDIASGLDKSFEAADRPRIRYSVTCYRDYCDIPTTYLIRRLPFTENAREVDKFLAEEKAEGGGDPPEAVFHGLDQAIASGEKEVTQFSYKVLILVGDAGNHPVDERGYTVSSIAKRIKDAHYEFASVQVVDPDKIDSQEEYKLFRDQTKAIRDQIVYGNKRPIETGDPAKVAEEIARRSFEYASELANAKAGAVVIDSGGGLRAVEQKYGVRTAERITRAMEAGGINVNLFLEKSVQIFGRGWTTENTTDGVAQNEIVLLVEKPTLEVLIGMIADLTQNPPNKTDISAVWGKVLKNSLGETSEDKPIAEMIENHLGLPIRTKILTYSLKQLATLDETVLKQAWDDLDRAKQQVSAFLNEKNVAFGEETMPNGIKKIVVKDLGTRTVWWQGEDQEYAWMKLTELP